MFIRRFIKKQVTLAIITFLMLGVVILGSSYALFQKAFVDEKTQSISVGDLNIVFSSGTKNDQGEYVELSDSNVIDLTNILPQTDEDAISKGRTYNFVIYNSGTIAYSYTIKLVDTANTTNTLSREYIRYTFNDSEPAFLNTITNNLLYSNIINSEETHTYTLRIWVADAEEYQLPDEVLNTEAHLSILIEGEASNDRV